MRGILRDKAGREWAVTAEKVIDAEEGYVLYDRAVSTELILAEVEVRLCAVVALAADALDLNSSWIRLQSIGDDLDEARKVLQEARQERLWDQVPDRKINFHELPYD